ncbi:carboxypeptidase B-like isoform X1 [Leptopilina boulardi]|uniref:carboxypeptidase B-like isoform X1 n=1 Tax=Leptopilina boulardi TaxID=63433 RepID=UPI0021F62F08|nr:carboxypeptidase B-like isoform X1 [Leptopilina boulardi]
MSFVYTTNNTMMNLFVVFFIISHFIFVTTEYIPSTKGMQCLSIKCDTEKKLAFVLKFQTDRDFDFISITRKPYDNVEVAITESKINNFKKQLEFHDIEYNVYIENVEKLIEEEKKMFKRRKRSFMKNNLPYSFDHFPRYTLINRYLEKIIKKHQDATLIDIGSSYEDRKMFGIKISNNNENKNLSKPAILIDAGIHAREWISITTALFIIQQLLKEDNKHLYRNVDWYIIPLMNPDGYEFSHDVYRLWRKTRSEIFFSTCLGVDGNRNYDYKWSEISEKIFEDPCLNTYSGRLPFSEIETKNMRDFVLQINETIKLYIDLHSTSQQTRKFIVLPWAYTTENYSDYSKLFDLAEKGSKAIFSHHGSNYTIGTASEIYYIANGTSIDWFLGFVKTNYSLCIELPSEEFIVSEDKIENIGAEIFEAIKIFGKHIEDNFVEE